MVYKKYVKRGGKTFGPYYYESYRDVNGKVKTRYLENYKPRGISSFSRASKKNVVGVGKYVLVFALVALLGFFAYSTFNSDNSSFSGKVVFDENISSDIPGSVDSSPNINETIVPPVVDETLGVVDETIIIPVVNETIIEIINNETINETIIIPVVNETINETTNETVANETINNEAINNETVILENIISGEFNVTTTKARIVIGRPVKWIKTVKIDSNNVGDVIVEIPKDAENVTVRTGSEVQASLDELNAYNALTESVDRTNIVDGGITGFVSLDTGKNEGFLSILWSWFVSLFRFTGRVIDESQLQGNIVEVSNARDINLTDIVESENANEVSVEYYTEAPVSIEETLIDGKRVRISGPDNSGYENILAYTELDNIVSFEDKANIRVYHIVDGLRQSTNFDSYDLDDDGNVDYVEWNVPHLSEQVYEIIYITKADHLDSSRNFVDDVYDYVKSQDNNWTTIPNGDFVRVTFEKPLTNKKDITIYARSNENSSVEVYREDGNDSIARFDNLNGEKNRILLTALGDGESYSTFDLKSLGDVEYDYIVDPGCPASMAGSGTLGDSCNITNCVQLQAMNVSLSLSYALINDIDCSDTRNWNGGLGFEPIGNLTDYFNGSFIGNDYTISNLYILRPVQNLTGLFGASLARLSLVKMVNTSVNGSFYVGGLVGLSWGKIDHVTMINSTISGNSFIGSLVGATIADVNTTGTINTNVSGNFSIGGLIGLAIWQEYPNPGPITPPYPTPYIEDSYAKGVVQGKYRGTSCYNPQGKSWTNNITEYRNPVGGLIGIADNVFINNTYSIANVSGTVAGGLVGLLVTHNASSQPYPYTFVTLENSYSFSSVNGSENSGGLMGTSNDVDVINPFFVGNVTNSSFSGRIAGVFAYGWLNAERLLGGIGYNPGRLINAWWYNSTDFPQWCVGNLAWSNNPECTAITPLEYFYNISNAPIVSWGFPPWDSPCNNYFPPLEWENQLGLCVAPFVCSPGVNCCGVLNISNHVYTLSQSIYTNGTCFNITADNVTLDGNGFIIDGNDSLNTFGVYASRRLNVTVKNFLDITDFYNGIHFDYTNQSIIINVTATSNSAGIYLYHSCSNNDITLNNFSANSQYGIQFYTGSNNNTITSNTLSLNGHSGVYLYSSSNNNITSNIANNNTQYGIYLDSSSNNTIALNNATLNNRGIYFSYQDTNNIINSNNVSSNRGIGMAIFNSNNNRFTSNIANNNPSYGILLDSSSNNILNSISASRNAIGVYILLSSSNILTSINASGNSDYGFYISSSSNNTLTSINASGNSDYGFYITSSSNNTLTSSDASGNGNSWYGILLDSSSNNNISSNIVYNNSVGDIYLNSLSNFNFGDNNCSILINDSISNTVTCGIVVVCVPDNSCAAITCSGSICSDGCGGNVAGSKTCPPPDSCFPAGTKISMADGSKKNIEDVVIGDYVLSYDTQNKKIVNAEVLDLESPMREHMCELTFEDNSKLKLTDEHPVYTSLGWKSIKPENSLKENPSLLVGNLVVGDNVLFGDEVYRTVIGLNCWNERIQTYNLKKISGFSNYFAGNVLVHNKGGGGDDCTTVTDYVWGKWGACDARNKMSRQRVSKLTPSCTETESKDCGCISNLTCGSWSGSCDSGTRVRFCEESCTGETVLSRDYCDKPLPNNLEEIAIDYPTEYRDALCGDWGKCDVNYNFVDLLSGIENLEGTQRSLCFDEKSGTNFYKVQSCSIKSNVFARKLLWCGKDYIEIVDIATNKTVSLINNDRNSKNPSLDIILLDDKPKYCEYCYNGVMDEDEEERDCGGSCKPCGIQESYWMTLLQRVMWSLKF